MAFFSGGNTEWELAPGFGNYGTALRIGRITCEEEGSHPRDVITSPDITISVFRVLVRVVFCSFTTDYTTRVYYVSVDLFQ